MSEKQDLTHFKKNYLVGGLSDDQVNEVFSIAEIKKFLAGERIICAGTTGADVFVILDGTVRVHLPYGDKLAEIGPGSVLGEMALIDALPRSADVVCAGEVVAAAFDAKTFRSHLNKNRELGFLVLVNLAQVLSGRLRESNAKIEFLSDSDVWKHAL